MRLFVAKKLRRFWRRFEDFDGFWTTSHDSSLLTNRA